MRALLSSTWVLALSCVSPAWALGPDAEGGSLAAYAEIVASYRRGDAGALQALGAFPEASLREATEHLSALARARREPPFPIPTAVLMHTDRALLDRKLGVREAEALKLGLARKLAASLGGEPASEDFRRRWYLAAAEAWKEGADWGFARELLDAGRKDYPRDARRAAATCWPTSPRARRGPAFIGSTCACGGSRDACGPGRAVASPSGRCPCPSLADEAGIVRPRD